MNKKQTDRKQVYPLGTMYIYTNELVPRKDGLGKHTIQ